MKPGSLGLTATLLPSAAHYKWIFNDRMDGCGTVEHTFLNGVGMYPEVRSWVPAHFGETFPTPKP